MVEWLFFLIVLSLCFFGILGSFLPFIPGPPLSYLALLFLHFSAPSNRVSTILLLVLLAATLLITIIDYIIPVWGTKKFGGTKYGVWGSTIGLIIGLFFGPFGIVLGPFFGAFFGELYAGGGTTTSLRSAWGSFVGFLIGTGLKILFTFFIAVFCFSKIINRVITLIQNM